MGATSQGLEINSNRILKETQTIFATSTVFPYIVSSIMDYQRNILFPGDGVKKSWDLQLAQLIPKDIAGLRRRSTWRPLYTNFIK